MTNNPNFTAVLRQVFVILWLLGVVSFSEASPDPTEEVMQAALDNPELDKYLHLDVYPHLIPLVLGHHGQLKSSVQLVKGGHPVSIIPISQLLKDGISGYLFLSRLEIGDREATVQFEFKLQGALIISEFDLQDGRWTLRDTWTMEY